MAPRVSSLTSGGSMTCGPGHLTVELLNPGASSLTGVFLELVDAAGQRVDPRLVDSPRPGLLVLLRLTDPVHLRLRPTSGPTVPAGLRVQVMVTIERSQSEREVVTGPEVEASALPFVDLLDISPRPSGGWSLRAPRSEAVTGDESLLRLAARAAARTIVGATRVAESERRTFGVLVDGSASMLVPHDSGVIGGVIELIGGVHDVFGASDRLQLWLAGDQVRQPDGNLPVEEVLSGAYARPCSGFSLQDSARRIRPLGRDTTVFVLTDDLPFDYEAFAAQLRVDREDAQWVVVALARSRFDAIAADDGRPLDPGSDQLRRTGDTSCRVVSIHAGSVPELTSTLSVGAGMRRVVEALVPGPPYTDPHGTGTQGAS